MRNRPLVLAFGTEADVASWFAEVEKTAPRVPCTAGATWGLWLDGTGTARGRLRCRHEPGGVFQMTWNIDGARIVAIAEAADSGRRQLGDNIDLVVP